MAPINKKKRAIMATNHGNDYSSDSNQGSSEASGSEHHKMFAKVNRMMMDKNSDEYRRKREKNNMAVKKSRTKSKQKTMETLHRVNALKAENVELQQKIDILSKELRLLKDLFMAHANNAHGAVVTEIDLNNLTSIESLQEASTRSRFK